MRQHQGGHLLPDLTSTAVGAPVQRSKPIMDAATPVDMTTGYDSAVDFDTIPPNVLTAIEFNPVPPPPSRDQHQHVGPAFEGSHGEEYRNTYSDINGNSKNNPLGNIDLFTQLWVAAFSGGGGNSASAAALKTLVLSDAQHPRYYLPNTQARVDRKARDAAREQARVDRMNAREAAMFGRVQRSTALNIIAAVKQGNIAWSKDRDAVDRLLALYASDEEKRIELMVRVKKIVEKGINSSTEHNVKDEEGGEDVIHADTTPVPSVPETAYSTAEQPPLIDTPSNTPRPPSTRQTRVASTLELRRATMISEYLNQRRNVSKTDHTEEDRLDALLRQEIEAEMDGSEEPVTSTLDLRDELPKSGRLPSPERIHDAFAKSVVLGIKEKQPSPEQRLITFVVICKFVNVLRDQRARLRQAKNRDYKTSLAVRLIQRRWRQSNEAGNMWQATSLALKDPADRERARALLEERGRHLSVITRFLTDASSGLKHHVSAFLRKIKLVQRRVRLHLMFNQHRRILIEKLFDRCLPIVLYWLTFIVTKIVHKPANSVHNVGSKKWTDAFGSGDKNRIPRDLMARTALEYINFELSLPARRHFKRNLQQQVFNLEVRPDVRAAIIAKLARKARWEELNVCAKVKKSLATYENIPTMHKKDALNFLKGKDPLQQYMNACDDAIRHVDTYSIPRAKDKDRETADGIADSTSKDPSTVNPSNGDGKTNAIAVTFHPFLKYISAFDVIAAVLDALQGEEVAEVPGMHRSRSEMHNSFAARKEVTDNSNVDAIEARRQMVLQLSMEALRKKEEEEARKNQPKKLPRRASIFSRIDDSQDNNTDYTIGNSKVPRKPSDSKEISATLSSSAQRKISGASAMSVRKSSRASSEWRDASEDGSIASASVGASSRITYDNGGIGGGGRGPIVPHPPPLTTRRSSTLRSNQASQR